MATAKITITLDEQHLTEIRSLVAAGQSPNTSSYVRHAVALALQDARGWREMLEEALSETGGPLSQEECAWADAILSPAQIVP